MQRLKELRKEAGLTLKQVGAAVGMSDSTISMYENDKHEPDILTLIKFANLYDVSVDYLIGRSDTARTPAQVKLSADERKLIVTYRGLNTDGRHALLTNAAIIAGNPDMQKDGVKAEIS